MKIPFKNCFLTVAAGGLLIGAATPVLAYESGDWLVRGRVIQVNPNDSSGSLYIGGVDTQANGVKVDSDTLPELDITYMFHRHWGVELILGYSKHTVSGKNSWAALGDVIETKVLPPTLTLQYHFRPDANIRPYMGAGLNYTHFFDEKVAGPVLPASNDRVSLDGSWGYALQAGVDIALSADWFLNLDMKYLDIDTTAHFKNTAVGRARISADIDPIVWGIGFGRRF